MTSPITRGNPQNRPALRAAPTLLLLLAASAAAQDGPAQTPRYFTVRAVDAETGRGVPLVELETVHRVLYVTDSAGRAAIDEPGLMGQQVFFHVRSHGYDLPADGFGMKGIRPVLTPGASYELKLTRTHAAERLYRVTGAGIYRDSVLLGSPAPLREPLLAGGVLGQDSVQTVIYRGKLRWFWGDTGRASYPLGNFHASGAVSALPLGMMAELAGAGRLGPLVDPEVGVDLTYFVGEDGFSRGMFLKADPAAPGPIWFTGLAVVAGEGGAQVMVCAYQRIKALGEAYEQGIGVWDDAREAFASAAQWPLSVTLGPLGHPFPVSSEDGEWLVYCDPYPSVRVRPRLADVLDPARYEVFTCLTSAAREGGPAPIETDAAGAAVWRWRPGGALLPAQRAQELEAARKLPAASSWHTLRDVETGAAVLAHSGDVAWNVHRRRWVLVASQVWGTSMLGEVWYAEGDTPLGPWGYARKVVTHDTYSFYNPRHHAYFDAQGGRVIYFEGTYTEAFSGAKRATPRYDYNQVMYRLDLDRQAVRLPVPVYVDPADPGRLATWHDLAPGARASAPVAFWALDRAREGAERLEGVGWVLPAAGPAGADPCVALHRWRRGEAVTYRADGDTLDGWQREDAPCGRVWPAPTRQPPRWADARAPR